jgi:hypothetical protein
MNNSPEQVSMQYTKADFTYSLKSQVALTTKQKKKLTNNKKKSLKKFLNTIPEIDKMNLWWKFAYVHYTSKSSHYSDYYMDNDKFINENDNNKALLIQTFVENKIKLDKESYAVDKYTQIYNDTIIYICPLKNLYYLDVLFRKMIDYDTEFVTNHNTYNMIDIDLRKKFYEFCFENTGTNKNTLINTYIDTNQQEITCNIQNEEQINKYKNLLYLINLANIEFSQIYEQIIKVFLLEPKNNLFNKLHCVYGKDKFILFMQNNCVSYKKLLQYKYEMMNN